MAESKPKRTLDDAAILSLYQTVLPYLYFNPENLDIPHEISKWLSDFIEYDSYHAMIDDSKDKEERRRVSMIFTQPAKEDADIVPLVSFQTSSSPDSTRFETAVKINYDKAIEAAKKLRPNIKEYHYFQLRSNETPQVVAGFFRRGPGNPFTKKERELFKLLEPHLLLMYRCALNQLTQTQAFHYFDGFAKLASRLAQEHGLSDAEIRLIPDILFGYSNEEIAEREFISVATVKSHIQHILKKTGTKSRHDLIGKFFTSPDHVRL